MATPTHILVAYRHKEFDRSMNAVWESLSLLGFYLPHLHELVKSGQAPTLSFRILGHRRATRTINRDNTLGVINRMARTAPRQAIVDLVLIFEDYLGDLMRTVLTRYPGRLLSSGKSDPIEREEKLLSVIVNASSKAEMVDTIVEEKIRAVFYGDPIEFFSKDKGRLEFGSYFTDHHTGQLASLRRVLAIRNVIIHNMSRVDRKFLREVPDSGYTLGQKVVVNADDVFKYLQLLKGLGAAAAKLVVEKVFRTDARGTIASHYNHYCPKD